MTMTELDPGAHAARLAAGSTAGVKTAFGDIAPNVTALPDGNETLAWLSGNRNPDRRKGLQPPSGASDPHADDVLSQPRPTDPIEAAQRRASVLADLHREAPRDPRVQMVFETDPIIAEDPFNGNLVTEAMLTARLDLFDAVLTMLGRAVLPRAARARAATTLKAAYRFLSDDAQVEWALSEVRLEETKAFLDGRRQRELNLLGERLADSLDRADLWAAAYTFAMAAHIATGAPRGSAALSDLLEMREIEA